MFLSCIGGGRRTSPKRSPKRIPPSLSQCNGDVLFLRRRHGVLLSSFGCKCVSESRMFQFPGRRCIPTANDFPLLVEVLAYGLISAWRQTLRTQVILHILVHGKCLARRPARSEIQQGGAGFAERDLMWYSNSCQRWNDKAESGFKKRSRTVTKEIVPVHGCGRSSRM
jgi:hypothetical protein